LQYFDPLLFAECHEGVRAAPAATEEMALVLEENRTLQASVNDLQPRLLQERHHREDLEVKVLALEMERRQMETESQSLAEQLSHSTNQ
jgi:hypothetical protein